MELYYEDTEMLDDIKGFLHSILYDDQCHQQQTVYQIQKSFAYQIYEDEVRVGAVLCHQTDEVIHIDLLGVILEQRDRDLGTMLMRAVEQYAQQHGCTRLTVTTLDFQAKSFYLKCGFEAFGMLENTPKRGVTKYYLTKKCG